MTDDYITKRRFQRIPSENPVLVQILEGEPHLEGFALTRVVGMGGCMFVNDESIGEGTHIQLFISVGGRVIETKGRVVYEIPSAPNKIEVGVEFTEITPWDRSVIEQLCSRNGAEDPAKP